MHVRHAFVRGWVTLVPALLAELAAGARLSERVLNRNRGRFSVNGPGLVRPPL